MCDIWKYPTHPEQEVTPRTLSKLPDRIDYLNLTGGEPTLRNDLPEIVEVLAPKAETLEISSNGLRADMLEAIVRKHPCIKIRISVEGVGERNDRIRGETGGYEKKLETMRRLKAAGGLDLGFATTFQDENIDDIVPMYRLCEAFGVEMATSALHNGFQFHKNDNLPYDRLKLARAVEPLITEMLKSNSVKTWFRAYLNLGLIAKILGHPRMLPCTAGTDFAFVDPFSDVYACNVRPDLRMGNLERQSWREIYDGPEARALREKVRVCRHNCWMVASAKTAMRHPRYAKLPKWGPLAWVLANKARVTLGLPIPFDRYIDYGRVSEDPKVEPRESYLGRAFRREMHEPGADSYKPYGSAMNR